MHLIFRASLLTAALLVGCGGQNDSAYREPSGSSAVVYVTRTGEKYHEATCRHLRKSKIAMSRSEASLRYDPCRVCKP